MIFKLLCSCASKTKYVYKFKLNFNTDVENKRMDTKGGKWQGGGDGMNWEIGIDMYTLIRIKWITNKNLLYKKSIKEKNIVC